MQPLITALPTLAVSATYCLWHAYHLHICRRLRVKHERVAFMLWLAANETDD